MSEQDAALETNPWTTRIYPREAGFAGFDRLMNFTDAVYAIALTLAALEIGLPEIEGNANSPGALWSAIVEKGPKLGAFVVAFAWVAIYWRANHKFTATLRAISVPSVQPGANTCTRATPTLASPAASRPQAKATNTPTRSARPAAAVFFF